LSFSLLLPQAVVKEPNVGKNGDYFPPAGIVVAQEKSGLINDDLAPTEVVPRQGTICFFLICYQPLAPMGH